MSKRQTIFDAVKVRFATATTANAYASNVGQKVFEWQLVPVDLDNLPCSLLSDPIEEALIDNKNTGAFVRQLTIDASLLLAEVNQTAAKARAALADVITAIGTDPRWGGLALRTLPVSEELKLDDEGERISGVRLVFKIEYPREAWEA